MMDDVAFGMQACQVFGMTTTTMRELAAQCAKTAKTSESMRQCTFSIGMNDSHDVVGNSKTCSIICIMHCTVI